MPVEVTSGSPLADAIQNAAQSKLVEAGWSTGDMDEGLSEFIVLMIVNGKSQQEIANELAGFLDLDPSNDSSPGDFARWLFEQVEILGGQPSQNDLGASTQPPSDEALKSAVNAGGDGDDQGMMAQPASDAQMEDTMENGQDASIPKGPRSMRDSGGQRNRDKRMLGQMNRTLNRGPEQSLHRIKGTAGTGRINSHSTPPKGPTPKGPRALANRNSGMQPRQMNSLSQMGAMDNMGNMPGMGNMAMSGNPLVAMTPQQQMQMFALMEEQARMMAQIMPPQQQGMMPNAMSFAPNGNEHQGKSLFDRVENKPRKHFNRQNGAHGSANHTRNGQDPGASMEVEPSSQNDQKADPETTMCHFNLYCTKAECPYVHQSPAAPPTVTVDMSDSCSYGVACMNRKCVGKHPSPAKRLAHKATQQCKFFPNCTNPTCPFEHPEMPLCRNGADCTVPGCKFFHVQVACKFNPCLNPSCPYKHEEGQKRGKFGDKVWINPEVEENEQDGNKANHVSERRFVNEESEEVIIPGKNNEQMEQRTEEVAS